MKNTEEIIWNYLDGQVDPETSIWVEKRLAEEEDFRELFLQSQLLHQSLKAVEAEEPSMRFSQNVMDLLPAVRNLAVSPLISAKGLRTIFGGVIGFLVLLLGSSWVLSSTVSGQDQQVDNLVKTLNSLNDLIPAGTLFMGGIITISLLLLSLLDRWLQSKFIKS